MLEWPTLMPLRAAPPPRPGPPLSGRPRVGVIRGGIVERLAEQISCGVRRGSYGSPTPVLFIKMQRRFPDASLGAEGS
jgi:hypothetical protein